MDFTDAFRAQDQILKTEPLMIRDKALLLLAAMVTVVACGDDPVVVTDTDTAMTDTTEADTTEADTVTADTTEADTVMTDTTEASLLIDEDDFTMAIGTTRQLTVADASGNPIEGEVQWTSSDESVLTVSASGLVDAVGAGESTVTASLNGVTDTVAVVVRDACNESPTPLPEGPTSGAITATDCLIDGDYTDRFEVTISEPTDIEISLVTFGGTSGRLLLLDSTGSEVSNGTTTGGLGGVTEILQAGTYTLRLSLAASAVGGYELTFRRRSLLRVVSASINDGATGVVPNQTFTVTFNKPVDPAKTFIEFETTPGNVGYAGEVVVDGATATLTPSTPLIEFKSSYRIYVHPDTTAEAGDTLGVPWEATFETVLFRDDQWYTILDNASNFNYLGVVTDTQNRLRVTSGGDVTDAHRLWRFEFDGDKLRIANRATDIDDMYLEGGTVGEISLMTGRPAGGGFFTGQGWRVEPTGVANDFSGISPPMRITPFAGGDSDLIQRNDDWAGLGTTGVVALQSWRFRHVGPQTPPLTNACGWSAANSYYDCGGSGADPSGSAPIACAAGLADGDPCSNTGLTPEGCCDIDGHNWYCTNDGLVFENVCQ